MKNNTTYMIETLELYYRKLVCYLLIKRYGNGIGKTNYYYHRERIEKIIYKY